jgi:hypothetical protein
MHAPFDNIVQHLFHQPSLLSVTIDELERMALQHPYFAAAHFLLLKKMQDTDHPQFNTQLHKTTLYFNNPLWLQFLLQPETVTDFKVSEKSPFVTGETAATIENTEVENIPAPAAYQPVEQESLTEEPDQINITTGIESTTQDSFDSAAPAAQAGIAEVITAVFNEPDEQPQPLTAPEEINTMVPEEIPVQPASEFITQADETITIAEPFAGNIPGEDLAGTIPEEIIESEPITEPEPTTEPEPMQDPIIAENNAGSFQQEAVAPIIETVEENGAVNLQTTETPPQNQEAPGITETTNNKEEKPLFKTIIETSAAQNDLLFEPYHTVDYFASQGIKLSKMEAKDKLGRQLKSFTDWLKTMKKLPQVSIEKLLAENEESKVVEDAIHSIENKEVITEAMAEVFEKQGLTEKAAEVYQKLSLLNPGKSAYFAAKIEVLKH